MKTPIAILTLLFLFGCQASPEQAEAVSQPAEPEAVAESPAPESPAPAQIMVTDAEGISGYPRGSAFDLSLVQSALPGYQVVEGTDGSEGMEWTVFHVNRDGQTLLQVNPGQTQSQFGSIEIISPDVVTDTGHGVGSKFEWIFAEWEPEGCQAGMEELSGKVICPAPDNESFHYVFSGAWNGPDGRVPPRDALDSWEVTTVIWTAL